MTDHFTNINRNAMAPQPLDIGQNQKVGGPGKGSGKAPGSVIGQGNGKSLKTAQQIWKNSVAKFLEANQGAEDADRASGVYIENSTDPVSKKEVEQRRGSMEFGSFDFSMLDDNKEDIPYLSDKASDVGSSEEPKLFEPNKLQIDQRKVSTSGTGDDLSTSGDEDVKERDVDLDKIDGNAKPGPKNNKLDNLFAELQKMAAENEPVPEMTKKEQYDKAVASRRKITPSMLQKARKKKLKELPVYLCSRPLNNNIPGMKSMGLHGFVAIGKPGMAKVKGAKVFSYGADQATASIKLDGKKIDKLAEAKIKIKVEVDQPKDPDNPDDVKDKKPKFIYEERDVFKPEAIASFRRLAASKKKFHNAAEFHRAYYAERMAHEEANNPNLLRAKTGNEERKLEAERLDQEYKDLLKTKPDKKTKLAAKEARKKARLAWREPLQTANITRLALHKAIAHDAEAAYQLLTKHKGGSDSSGLPGDALRGWQPTTGSSNLANADADLFDEAGAEAKPGVEFRRQHGIKATDVIEAQRQQWVADQYRDEKAGGVLGAGLAPELSEPVNVFDVNREHEEVAQDFQDLQDAARKNLVDRKYAPITEGDKTNTIYGLESKAIRDTRSYSPLLVVRKERKGFLLGLLSYFKRKFQSKKSKLRNEGNCNAAAGSLIRLAAQRGGKRIQPEGGKRQHGISRDVLWNPTPNLRPEPQKRTEFVSTGKRMPDIKEDISELDLDSVSEAPSKDEIAAFKPDSARLKDVTVREVNEFKQGLKALNSAYHALHETKNMMDDYAPKPSMRRKPERFQAVRDEMHVLMLALEAGNDKLIRQAAGDAAKAADTFHETRMDEYTKKTRKVFDSSSANVSELRALVSLEGAHSGKKKMLLANSVKQAASSFLEERQKLIDNMEQTLAKPAISDIEAQKLLIGAEMLSRITLPDEALADLGERALERVITEREAGRISNPTDNGRGSIV